MMDALKLLMDRLFGFVVTLVPGSVILLLLILHRPDLLSRIWANQFLTYETKIWISLFAVFAFGYSATYAFGSITGGLLGGIFGVLGPPKDPDVKPWQIRHWRVLVGRYLRERAPQDLAPISDEILQGQLTAVKDLPVKDQLERTNEIYRNKALADANDEEWNGWWRYFHVRNFTPRTPLSQLHVSTTNSFYVASFILLFSMPFTPEVRFWWLALFCLFWVLNFVLVTIVTNTNLRHAWSSYEGQIMFFQERLENDRPVLQQPEP